MPSRHPSTHVRSSGLRIDELRYMSCRYIISNESAVSIRYCGKNRERGSYCEKHGALCYLPTKPLKVAVSAVDNE